MFIYHLCYGHVVLKPTEFKEADVSITSCFFMGLPCASHYFVGYESLEFTSINHMTLPTTKTYKCNFHMIH
jgi:hypothetical protein